ncbi:MAG TPA: sulfate ABC transporter substrate-binding protein [Tepidisphaeraceae bacterium]
MIKQYIASLAIVIGVSVVAPVMGQAPTLIRSASYEPTVELYKDLNPAFEKWYRAQNGKPVKVETFHGPSGKQAQAIIAGNKADVATLSVDYDIDQIAKAGLIDAEWRKRLPNGSVPYYSAVVFLVRAGNPKNIKSWEDLARDDVTALAPDPKTGGGARWIYLSTWAHGLRVNDNDEAKAREFTRKVYDKAVLDPAMRQSTNRFVQESAGDVLFGWENEILQIVKDPEAGDDYQVVVPSDSITIEVPVAVVDKVAAERGTTEAAEAYLKFLYTDEGQEIIAKRFNRPSNAAVAEKFAEQFPKLTLFKFSDHFTNWPDVMKQHFATGAELDQMRK